MKFALAAFAAISLSQCSDNGAYTLYREGVGLPDMRNREGVGLPDMRIHIATFNSNNGDKYNRENCQLASNLFSSQAGVTVRYWCEKGAYRK